MSDVLRAALWMTGAIASFTTMAISGRQVGTAYDTFEIMLYRSLVGIVVVLSCAAAFGSLHQIGRQRAGLHLLRNVVHFTGQNLWFYALTLIPLAQLFALEFSTPIWVVLLSPLLLRERLTAIGLGSALVGFIGILLVAAPTGASLGPGFLAGAACAVFFALTAIFTRMLTRTEPITRILMNITAMQAVFGLVCAGWDGAIRLPDATFAPWLGMIGLAGLSAHFCLTKALSLAPASVIMPMDFARLPVIALIGAAFYGEPLSGLIFVGAALIFAANWINTTRGQGRRSAA